MTGGGGVKICEVVLGVLPQKPCSLSLTIAPIKTKTPYYGVLLLTLSDHLLPCWTKVGVNIL